MLAIARNILILFSDGLKDTSLSTCVNPEVDKRKGFNMLAKGKYLLAIFTTEGLIWVLVLFILALQNPYSSNHYTLFWPSLFWDIKSPGYNLGHAISFLFRGEIIASINTHYLGIPTVLLLIHRILSIVKINMRKELKYG